MANAAPSPALRQAAAVSSSPSRRGDKPSRRPRLFRAQELAQGRSRSGGQSRRCQALTALIAIKVFHCEKKGERYGRLKEIKQPTPVFTWIDNVMIPTVNSYILARHRPDARLVLYPDSGHGALFQYSDQFCAEVNALLVKTVNRHDDRCGRRRRCVPTRLLQTR